MVRELLSAATLFAFAAYCAPALAHAAPWSASDPSPLPVQFLVGISLMAVAGVVFVWQGAALVYEALAQGRKRHRAA